jgi:hypothetical protein
MSQPSTTETIGPDQWEWWWGVWRDRIRCGSCRALMDHKAPCPICSADYRNLPPLEMVIDGRTVMVHQGVPGALDWSPYAMLQLMHRDWLRPLSGDGHLSLPEGHRTSPRVLVVLIFWTYFETLMGWFYETAMSDLPPSVAADLLGRYNSIGSRLDRLHRILFKNRYVDDLDQLGYTSVRQHLEKIQQQRNSFVHGSPEAISDQLVNETVMAMPSFQQAWIESFNLRCAKRV